MHADETRWRVFVKMDKKAGFVWYLWVFALAISRSCSCSIPSALTTFLKNTSATMPKES